MLFAPILPVRAASQGQKPADDFLNEEGQIRLGKRQARRQAKKSFHAKPQSRKGNAEKNLSTVKLIAWSLEDFANLCVSASWRAFLLFLVVPLCNANEKYTRNRMRMRQVAFCTHFAGSSAASQAKSLSMIS
ncbi:hypothetical protein L0337_10285 [candidate division KSB1 bacterium]|nr:hypothetical protein [candidate division KSB1 bacterium]